MNLNLHVFFIFYLCCMLCRVLGGAGVHSGHGHHCRQFLSPRQQKQEQIHQHTGLYVAVQLLRYCTSQMLQSWLTVFLSQMITVEWSSPTVWTETGNVATTSTLTLLMWVHFCKPCICWQGRFFPLLLEIYCMFLHIIYIQGFLVFLCRVMSEQGRTSQLRGLSEQVGKTSGEWSGSRTLE